MDLILANNREHFSRMDEYLRSGERARWQGEDAMIATLAGWWPVSGHDAVRLLPAYPPASVVGTVVVAPGAASLGVCAALLSSQAALADLAQRLDGHRVRPVLWSSEPISFDLLDALRDRGVHVDASRLPDRDRLETIWQLDTKSGLRYLAAACPDVRLPTALVVAADAGLVLEAVVTLLGSFPSVVVKADRSVGGWGQSSFVTTPEKALVEAVLASSGIWQAGHVVVEERVLATSSPSVDAEVLGDGRVLVTLLVDQVLDEARACVGASWPVRASADQVHAIEIATHQLGAALAKHGHRGPFNVDFVLSTAGEVYTVEVNVRSSTLRALPPLMAVRSSGTVTLDVPSLARALSGLAPS